MPIFYTDTASIDNLLITGSGVSMLGTMFGSFSGSFNGSFLGTIATASYITGSAFNSTNPVMSASYALTASYALNAAGTSTTINSNADNRLITGDSAANTLNAESNLTFNGSTLAVTGNVTATSFTGSLLGTATTASYVTGSIFSGNNSVRSASYALTASYALSGVGGSPSIFTINGASFNANGEPLLLTGSNGLVATITDATTNLTASFGFPTNAQVTLGGVTGSLFGTSSWALNALSSSKLLATGTSEGNDASYIILSLGSTGLAAGQAYSPVSLGNVFINPTKRTISATSSWAVTASYALSAGVAGAGAQFVGGTNVENRIITATGATPELNGEPNLTFDGSTLRVTGSLQVSGSIRGLGAVVLSGQTNFLNTGPNTTTTTLTLTTGPHGDTFNRPYVLTVTGECFGGTAQATVTLQIWDTSGAGFWTNSGSTTIIGTNATRIPFTLISTTKPNNAVDLQFRVAVSGTSIQIGNMKYSLVLIPS